jgi:3-ketosteroid 9alpha-monooxygenase subunit B
MIESMKALLGAAGVPATQIRHEIFEAAVAAAAEAPPRSASAANGSAYRLACTKSRRQVTVGRGQTLLEAVEGAGIEVASLCRAGVCGTCRVRVTEGTMAGDSSALDAEEVSAGFVLACVATALSDCEAEL